MASEPPMRASRPILSCAECRRLKLKCDKKVPCSSCRRRGCTAICPSGQMVSKGTRFVLANTEQLHDKIDVLISRVRHLEEALEISHSHYSQEPHPLLGKELRRLAAPVDLSTVPPVEPGSKEEEIADSLGTLALDGHGSRYFGSTGAFAYLWRDGDGPADESGVDSTGTKYKGMASQVLAELPPELAHMAHAFPISLPNGDTAHLSTWILENCLPPYEEAWSLFENYWEHYAWHTTPFTRAGFLEQILSPIYRRSPDDGSIPLGHRLALLFMVIGIGEFMDFTQPLGPSSGLRYYLLSRASLCLDPVFESPTVTALQAMYLMGIYIMMSRGTYEPEHAWILSGINTKLALTLGLQYDATKFRLPSGEVEARRQVLVSILCFEIWQSLSVGRQPSYTFANFDWVLPKEPEPIKADAPLASVHWTALFIRDCVSKVSEFSVGNKESSYSAVLQLDTKIKEYPALNLYPADNVPETLGEPLSVREMMKRTVASVIKEVSRLFLHRRFFALALKNSPDDLLKSPFAPSVLACHRSASTFVSTIRALHSAAPEVTLRVWFIWPNVFVATLILGSIVARSPGCSLASSALMDLEFACQLWETTSDSVCGPKVLATVRRLKHKAFMAFAQSQGPNGRLGIPKGLDVSDEIAALGGGGFRVVSSSPKHSPSPSSSSRTLKQTPSPVPAQCLPATGVQESQYIAQPETTSFTGDAPIPVFPQFDTTGAGFLPYGSDFMVDSLPSNFDEIFQAMATTTPAEVSTVGPTVLEELGLEGGWQPVMDDLGL